MLLKPNKYKAFIIVAKPNYWRGIYSDAKRHKFGFLTSRNPNKYKGFRSKISILPVTEADIDKAFSRNWKDFEDAVQYTVAETNNVDCIITRNKKDFEEDNIPKYEPTEFLEKFNVWSWTEPGNGQCTQ